VQGLNKSLLENSAITLGRLGWVCPELVAPHMDHFMQPWCSARRSSGFQEEQMLCWLIFIPMSDLHSVVK
jgi:hypothetical protein